MSNFLAPVKKPAKLEQEFEIMETSFFSTRVQQ